MGTNTYTHALKAGQKEYKACLARGADPYLPALEQFVTQTMIRGEESLGLMSIPMELVVGTRNTKRRDCFSPSFAPLLDEKSEFGSKWAALSTAHLKEGIRDPIKAVEYMNRYYVVEGHKRVSVLRYFGCPTVSATVTRLVPVETDSLESRIYSEYVAFFEKTRVNYIQFNALGKYEELLRLLDIDDERPWDIERQREFFADCTRFRRAYQAVADEAGLDRDEALLRYLQIYGYNHLRSRSPAGLDQDIRVILAELKIAVRTQEPALSMEPEGEEEEKSSFQLFRRWINPELPVLKVAFLHDKTPETSWWTEAHEKGRVYAQERLGEQIQTASFYNMLQENAEERIAALVDEGYSVIFTTTPRLLAVTLRSAANYPNVKFLNCSLNTNHPILKTYYGRMYEAKFLTGALAAACCPNGKIGYICNYPVYGAPASINAFALGARMFSDSVQIILEWSTAPGNDIEARFREEGVTVVSGHDMYSSDQHDQGFGVYYLDKPEHEPIAISTWNWGRIYERIISTALYGLWYDHNSRAINYWWGLASGAVQVSCSDTVPARTRRLASLMRSRMANGQLTPFEGPIYDQAGELRIRPGEVLTPSQIVQMDWLVSNVIGSIPPIDSLSTEAQALVEIQGVLKDQPAKKE